MSSSFVHMCRADSWVVGVVRVTSGLDSEIRFPAIHELRHHLYALLIFVIELLLQNSDLVALLIQKFHRSFQGDDAIPRLVLAHVGFNDHWVSQHASGELGIPAGRAQSNIAACAVLAIHRPCGRR